MDATRFWDFSLGRSQGQSLEDKLGNHWDPIKEIARITFYDVGDEEGYDDIYDNDVDDGGGGKIAYCASVQAQAGPNAASFLPILPTRDHNTRPSR